MPHPACQQLIGQAGLAGASRAGDPDHRNPVLGAPQRLADLLRLRLPRIVSFEDRNRAAELSLITGVERPQLVWRLGCAAYARKDVVDHAVQAELPPVLRRVDLLDAVPLESLDFLGRDGATTADDHADVVAAALPQHVDHVREVFVVAALVRADRHRVRVFLYRGAHNVSDTAVVPKVHDLGAMRLQEPPDHVYGGVVAVEEGGGGYEAQRPFQANGRGLRQRGATSGAGVHA